MKSISDKQFWAEGSGLLPVRISPNNCKDKYIMLDGGLYDFCLDLSQEDDNKSDFFSAAWSSDVKNYISVHDDYSTVYNWSRNSVERVKNDSIKNKFSSFIKILNSSCYRTADDITPFILSLFAQLRNITEEKQQPVVALNLLFKLLISLKEDVSSKDICDKWGILDISVPKGFDSLINQIQEGVRHIKPNLDYILRHGSGPLFESAHREALYFDNQLLLFGGISSNLGYALQAKYTGVHYTPRYLVRSIVENSLKRINLNQPSITILDPACGSGAFLQEVLKQLRETDYQGKIHVKGYDISPMAEQTTKFLLNYENRQQWGGKISIDIIKQDSLKNDWGKNDLILMNPPFLSSELIKDLVTKNLVSDVLIDLKMKKRPNMAAAFLYKAINSLSEDGCIGAVLPSSIMIQEQYQPLRDRMREITDLKIVAQLGNFVFPDALADTSFVIAKKKNDAGVSSVPLNIWCRNKDQCAYEAIKGWRKMEFADSSESINDSFNIYTPSKFPLVKDLWKVLPKKDDVFYRFIIQMKSNKGLVPLSDVFSVKQGVLKGNKDLFEIDDNDYSTLPDEERRLFRVIASSQTIENGHVRESSYLWYPYSSSGLMITSEEDLKSYKWSYNWLKSYKEVLMTRTSIKYWWELTRARSELFSKKERLLCSKRAGDIHSFAITPLGAVVEEGNVFLFKNNYLEDDKFFYLSFFSSEIFHRMLTIFARPLKAGFDMGNIQIKDIPIIDIDKSGLRSTDEYKQLVELGKEYYHGFKGSLDVINRIIVGFFEQ